MRRSAQGGDDRFRGLPSVETALAEVEQVVVAGTRA
jgi:hypothetical protein